MIKFFRATCGADYSVRGVLLFGGRLVLACYRNRDARGFNLSFANHPWRVMSGFLVTP